MKEKYLPAAEEGEDDEGEASRINRPKASKGMAAGVFVIGRSRTEVELRLGSLTFDAISLRSHDQAPSKQ